MQPVQTAFHDYNQNAHAQHEAAFIQMAAGQLLDRQFQQRYLLGVFGQTGWHFPKSAWKLGHAIRAMMDPGSELVPALTGIVELDEKYIGGKPRYQEGVVHKRGRGTRKQ
jgi:hypothetical protein